MSLALTVIIAGFPETHGISHVSLPATSRYELRDRV